MATTILSAEKDPILTISTIIELIVCGYFLLNSKKMKFPSKNCFVVYSLCLY